MMIVKTKKKTGFSAARLIIFLFLILRYMIIARIVPKNAAILAI